MSLTPPNLTVTAAVELAVKHYGDPNITVAQLADLVGFVEQEKTFAIEAWTLVNAHEWIYLSDEIILKQLATELEGDIIQHYITCELQISDYIYGHDYVRILFDGTILNEHGAPTTEYDINFHYPNLASYINQPNKQYWIISPCCAKELLRKTSTRRGSEARGYFVKAEKLATIMHAYIDYIGRLHTERRLQDEHTAHQIAIDVARKAKDEIIRAQAEIARMKTHEIHMNTMRFPSEPLKPDGRIYIATSAFYEKHHTFKIGRTKNSARVRLQQYKTGRTSTDRFRYLFVRDCFETKATETKIKNELEPYLEDPTSTNSEMFIIGFEDLRALVNMCIDHSTRECEFLNQRWARRREIVEQYEILPIIPSVDPNTSQSAFPITQISSQMITVDSRKSIEIPARTKSKNVQLQTKDHEKQIRSQMLPMNSQRMIVIPTPIKVPNIQSQAPDHERATELQISPTALSNSAPPCMLSLTESQSLSLQDETSSAPPRSRCALAQARFRERKKCARLGISIEDGCAIQKSGRPHKYVTEEDRMRAHADACRKARAKKLRKGK